MKEHDSKQLDRDIREAERLGYGLHYGDYMAAKENATKDYQERVKAAAERGAKKNALPKQEPEAAAIPSPQKKKRRKRVCLRCGDPLPKGKQKWCASCSDAIYLENRDKAQSQGSEAKKV